MCLNQVKWKLRTQQPRTALMNMTKGLFDQNKWQSNNSDNRDAKKIAQNIMLLNYKEPNEFFLQTHNSSASSVEKVVVVVVVVAVVVVVVVLECYYLWQHLKVVLDKIKYCVCMLSQNIWQKQRMTYTQNNYTI